MSVIQKIRTKYAKLAGGVIAVALVAFILMDALSSRSGSLFGNDTSVAKVNGEKIEYVEYSQRNQNYEVLYANNQDLDDNNRAQINSMALQDLVKEKLIKEEAEELGLTVTEEEKEDMIYGNDPAPAVKNYQAFVNPNTKTFDPQYVKLFEEQANQIDPTGNMLEQWEVYKEYIKRNSLIDKYNKLFTSGAYVPSFLSKFSAAQQAQMADIDYVSITIDDLSQEAQAIENIKLTDEDYKNYMQERKQEFYIEEDSRTVEYVSFDIIPDSRDTARALGVLQELKNDFAAAEDNESFVNRNSEESFVDRYVMKDGYQSRYADSVFSASVGTTLGPIFENQNYKLIKVLDKKEYPDSVRCRHILVKTQDRGQATLEDSVAKLKIDSAIAGIKSGASFAEMVNQYSDDEGSKEKGGEYSFTFDQKANLSTEFGDFIFNGRTGQSKMVKVENSSYAGYHYIEILNQGEIKPALKLATITKALYAGDQTENEIYADATEFASNSQTAAEFDSTVSKSRYQKRTAGDLKPYDYTSYGLGPCREVIRWAYNAEKGDVSQVFALNGKFVVAKLTEVSKKGMRQLTPELRDGIALQVKERKALKDAAQKFAGKNSLEDIAGAVSKEVQSLDSVRGNNSFSGSLGYAPKVVGYAMSEKLALNKVSEPIVGQTGVYFIKVKNRYKSEQQDTIFMQREKEMLQMEVRNTLESEAIEELKKNASIEYNPDNF